MEESTASSMLEKEEGFCGWMVLWLGWLFKLSSIKESSCSRSSSMAAAVAGGTALDFL